MQRTLLKMAAIALGFFLLASPFIPPASAGGTGYGFSPISAKRTTPAPAFTLRNIDGKEVSLKEFSGEVVIINFWASWCKPCKEEFPSLVSLFEELGKDGLTILAVAEDSKKRVLPFTKEFTIKFPVLIDRYGKVMKRYRASVLPSSVVIDRRGDIRSTLAGPQDFTSKSALEYFKRLLKEGG